MAKFSLRAYNREIGSLIDNGQIDEAIAHCQYILQSYPKYIETYRLLGKAYLEGQQHKEAIDVFQRVLTVSPDDFITHIGMSIIREDEGNLDAAIWHMERAFEVQPSNQAIQDELKHLYGKRDGEEPLKIRLTRGALCRMYARGNQYRQAVAEIKSLLGESPDRVDLEVLLARMYYNLNMKTEATELCGRLLNKFPYCLEANRLMLKLMLDSGKTDESLAYKQRIVSLDPYESQVNAEYSSSDQVPEDLVAIDKLVYVPGQKIEQPISQPPNYEEEEGAPDWLVSDLTGGEELGVRGFTRILDSSNVPSEEHEDNIPVSSQEEPKEESSFIPFEPVQTPNVNINEPAIPDESILTSTTTQQVDMESVEDQLPDWLKDTEKTGGTTEVTIPDWLKESGWAAAGSITEDTPPASVIHLESEVEVPETPIVPAEIPDWVQGLAPVGQDTELPQEKAISSEGEASEEVNLKLDDWLSGEEPKEAATISGGTASLHLPDEEEQVESATPDWLKGLDEQAGTTVESSTVFATGSTPSNQITSPSSGTIYPQPPQTDKLKMEDDFPVAGGTSILSPDDVPDWLQDLAPVPEKEAVPAPEIITEPSPTPTPPADIMAEPLPTPTPPADIMAEPSPTPTPPSDISLEEPTRPAPRVGAPVQEVVTSTLPPEESLPDWLPDLTRDSSPITTSMLHEETEGVSAEMPSWLNILDQENPEELGSQEPSTPVEEFGIMLNIEAATPEEVGKAEEKPTTSILPPNPEEQAEELPDWLKELDGYPEGTSPIADAAQSTSNDFPDWLKSFSDSEPVEQAPITPASLDIPPIEDEGEGEVPNWLSDLDLKGSAVESSAVDVPDWLRGLGPEPESELTAETPAQQPISEPSQPLSEEVQPTTEEAQLAEEIPDWIKSLQSTGPEAEEHVESEAIQESGELNEPLKVEETPVESIVEPVIGMGIAESMGFQEPETLTTSEEAVSSEVPETPEVMEPIETAVSSLDFESAISEEIPSEAALGEVESVETMEPSQTETIAGEQTTEGPQSVAAEEVVPSVSLEEEVEEQPIQEVAESQPTQPELEQAAPELEPAQKEEMAEKTPEVSPVEFLPVEEVSPEYDEIFSKAADLVDAGDLETAQEQFLRLIKAENHLDQVVEKLSSAVEANPTDSGLWMTLGDALGRSGKLQNALDAYTKAEEYLQ